MGVMLPREKLNERGLASLTDVELIMILLGSGVDGRNVASVAKRVSAVIRRQIEKSDRNEESQMVNHGPAFGCLRWNAFVQVHGVGKVKAMQIVCALELGRRLFAQERNGETVVASRNDVIKLFDYLKQKKQEHMIVVALGGRNQVLGQKTIAIGSLNKAVVEPRDIFVWALERNAAGIVLVHNHPSGNVTPSKADVVFTDRVKSAAELLGIELVDHVIV